MKTLPVKVFKKKKPTPKQVSHPPQKKNKQTNKPQQINSHNKNKEERLSYLPAVNYIYFVYFG